jgi:membrane protease subunit HflC
MSKNFVIFLSVLAVGLITISQAFFIVDETEQAFVLQLGQPVGNPEKPESFIKQPGLHMKIPVIQEVKFFDSRILAVDPAPEQVVISSATIAPVKEGEVDDGIGITNVTGEPIILDTFARYQIVDPLQFYKTLFTVSAANSRLESILTDATKAELGKTSLQDLLSPKRTIVMAEILKRVNRNIELDNLGIKIIDVRIVRADLTADLRTSTVRRMISELQERATETRAIGEERALEIRSTAEKERTVLLAEAQRDSEILRGEGDKDAIKIYAEAFNKDKEFYAFIRSMEAYRNTLSDPNTQMILSPDSDFLRYLGDSSNARAQPQTP